MKSLPYEVLMMIALLATQEDRNTAVRLASICRDFANMMIPIIYRAVIYRENERSNRTDETLAKPSFETLLKYGHHVRRLHLRVEYDSTARAILDRCLKVRDLYIGYPTPIADPHEHHQGDKPRPTILSETFLHRASLQKFSIDTITCLPDNYHESYAFSSLTHTSWYPSLWSGDVQCGFPNLTHLAVEYCVKYEKVAEILRKCKRLEVLALGPCFSKKGGLAAAHDLWQSRVEDKRVVTIGRPSPDPDGIMPEYGCWEMGSALVKEGWSLEKAWWEPTSDGSERRM